MSLSSSSSSCVTVSTSRRRSWSRQRLRTMLRQPRQRLALGRDVGAGVMPDVDEGFLQHLLGGGRFTQDTQRDPVQMRRGQPVELGERRLVGQRRAREQLRERGRCARDRAVGPSARRLRDARSAGAVGDPCATARPAAPAARLSARASTNSRSDSRFRYLRAGSPTGLGARERAPARARRAGTRCARRARARRRACRREG